MSLPDWETILHKMHVCRYCGLKVYYKNVIGRPERPSARFDTGVQLVRAGSLRVVCTKAPGYPESNRGHRLPRPEVGWRG